MKKQFQISSDHKRIFLLFSVSLLLFLLVSSIYNVSLSNEASMELTAFDTRPKESASPESFSCCELPYIEDEYVLLFDSPFTEETKARFLSSFPTAVLLDFNKNYLLTSVPREGGKSSADTLSLLRAFDGVCAADPNYLLTPCNEIIDTENQPINPTPAKEAIELPVNDQKSSLLPSIDEFTSFLYYNISNGISQFHSTIKPNKEVLVAIADTGIDISHPALAPYIFTNEAEIPGDGIDNDGNGYIDDINGWDFYHDDASVCHYAVSSDSEIVKALAEDNDNHGTHVAGIIVSVLQGGILEAVDTPAVPVRLLPLKINGGENASGTVAGAIKAIQYAVMMNADICNISWGTSIVSSSIQTLQKTIEESDMLFICAAGNTGENIDESPVYPASFRLPNLLSVTFINSYGYLTSNSNYGKDSIDCVAPGLNIRSSIIGDYAFSSGSSMAVPYISGIAALLYSTSEGLSPTSIRSLLLDTAFLLPQENPIYLPGNMLASAAYVKNPVIPDLSKAISSINSLPVDLTAPDITTSFSYTKDLIQLKVEANDHDGSGVRILKYYAGTKQEDAFARGTQGSSVTDGVIRFAKEGKYTLYASDYAGNEALLHVTVVDDKTPPNVSPLLHISPLGKRVYLRIKAEDAESELVSLLFCEGEYTAADFPVSSALSLSLENPVDLYLPMVSLSSQSKEENSISASSIPSPPELLPSPISGSPQNLAEENEAFLPSMGEAVFTDLLQRNYTIYAKDVRGNACVTVIDIPLTSTNHTN